jgi:GAF domain-containing protein
MNKKEKSKSYIKWSGSVTFKELLLFLNSASNQNESHVDYCREIAEAPNLKALLHSRVTGYRLTFHALECPECAARMRPYWNARMQQLSPSRRGDLERLESALAEGCAKWLANPQRRLGPARDQPKPVAVSYLSIPQLDGTASVIRRGAVNSPYPSIERVRQIADEVRRDLGASSCTFYVRDPYWEDELRLVACPGVTHPETMFGFLSPETSRRIVMGEGCTSFSEDAQWEPSRRNSSFMVPQTIPDSKRHLFGDFISREGVVSSARLSYRDRGVLEAVLFVNYTTSTTFDEPLRARIQELLRRLAAHLPGISEDLQLGDAPTLRQMISILKPAQQLAAIGLNEETSLESYFKSILDAAMDATGLTPETGVGTIHLYQEDAQLLFLAAYRGNAKWIERSQFQQVSRGVGVISWVALGRRPIIIRNLESSWFGEIHVSLKEGIKSELAVPMLAGEHLLGVLNLESVENGTFAYHHARTVAYAANNAAVAARLFREVDNNRQLNSLTKALLACFHEATEAAEGAKAAVHSLAGLAAEWLKASGCNVWCFDPERNPPFYNAGTTFSDFDQKERPRLEGWSHYICINKRFAWLTNIRSCDEYDVFFWDAPARIWKTKDTEFGSVRKGLHNKVVRRHVQSELGIPIVVKDRCLGLAWVEYDKPSLLPPYPDQMSLALGFAAGAGLILQLQLAEMPGEPEERLRVKTELVSLPLRLSEPIASHY